MQFMIVVMCCATPLYGAYYNLITNVGTSAKMIGLGNIQGFDQSAAGVFENPASLHLVNGTSFSGFKTTFMDSLNYVNLALASRTPIGTFAMGVMQASSGDIPLTVKDANNEVKAFSYFDYQNVVGKLGYQVSLSEHLHIGSNLNYYFQRIHTVSGVGMNLDLGLMSEIDDLLVSFTLKNYMDFPNIKLSNTVFYSNSSEETLPAQGVLSTRYRLSDFDLYSQLYSSTANNSLGYSLGVKYQPEFIWELMYLSMGYRQYATHTRVKHNVAIGLGLELNFVNAYFAFDKSEYYQQDNKFYYSVSVNI